VIHRAEREVESCEYCHPDDAEIPFDWLLAEVTGKRGAFEFILSEPARCPNCKHEITEKTLVEPRSEWLMRIPCCAAHIATRKRLRFVPKFRNEILAKHKDRAVRIERDCLDGGMRALLALAQAAPALKQR